MNVHDIDIERFVRARVQGEPNMQIQTLKNLHTIHYL